jgi:hypothetical protein
MGSEWILGRLVGECGLDSTGSGQGPVAGCGECGDEPSGSRAKELVSYMAADLRSLRTPIAICMWTCLCGKKCRNHRRKLSFPLRFTK